MSKVKKFDGISNILKLFNSSKVELTLKWVADKLNIYKNGKLFKEVYTINPGETISSGHIIEDEGTPLTARDTINFTGAGVTTADSGGKTVVTIPGSATNSSDGAENTIQLSDGAGGFTSKTGFTYDPTSLSLSLPTGTFGTDANIGIGVGFKIQSASPYAYIVAFKGTNFDLNETPLLNIFTVTSGRLIMEDGIFANKVVSAAVSNPPTNAEIVANSPADGYTVGTLIGDSYILIDTNTGLMYYCVERTGSGNWSYNLFTNAV